MSLQSTTLDAELVSSLVFSVFFLLHFFVVFLPRIRFILLANLWVVAFYLCTFFPLSNVSYHQVDAKLLKC